MLRDVLSRASTTPYGDRVALYVVQLTDPLAFALAERLHAQIPGPDPAVVRDRARAHLLRVPFMPGAAPVETLARILETLGPDRRTAALRAWAVREAHASGAVPVVILQQEGALITTLAALDEENASDLADVPGWFRPGPMDA